MDVILDYTPHLIQMLLVSYILSLDGSSFSQTPHCESFLQIQPEEETGRRYMGIEVAQCEIRFNKVINGNLDNESMAWWIKQMKIWSICHLPLLKYENLWLCRATRRNRLRKYVDLHNMRRRVAMNHGVDYNGEQAAAKKLCSWSSKCRRILDKDPTMWCSLSPEAKYPGALCQGSDSKIAPFLLHDTHIYPLSIRARKGTQYDQFILNTCWTCRIQTYRNMTF